MEGRFCTTRLMLRSATYCTSGSLDSSVTSGGAIFLAHAAARSSLLTASIARRTTLAADSTTAPLACCRRGRTRSAIFSASLGSDMS
jgi:hypothetical protein